MSAPPSSQSCDAGPCPLDCGYHELYSSWDDCKGAGWAVCEGRWKDDGLGEHILCWKGFD